MTANPWEGWMVWVGQRKVGSKLLESVNTHFQKPGILEQWEKWGIQEEAEIHMDWNANE